LDQLKGGHLVGDTLSFRFYVRNPNYRCLSSDQKRYADKLEVRVKELERLVCDHNSSRLHNQSNNSILNVNIELMENEGDHHNEKSS
jgi:hypothetical protein